MNYPRDKASRVNLRNQHFVTIMLRALDQANVAGSTLKCSGANGRAEPLHANDHNGCTNDGSSCLCWCHDHRDDPNPTAVG